MKPEYSHFKSLTDRLDESLCSLRELLGDINKAAAREPNYEAANRLRDFYDKIDAAVDDMDDAADTLLIDILSTDAQSC